MKMLVLQCIFSHKNSLRQQTLSIKIFSPQKRITRGIKQTVLIFKPDISNTNTELPNIILS
jgi:hypothetical protein